MNVAGSGRPRNVPKASLIMRSAASSSLSRSGRTVMFKGLTVCLFGRASAMRWWLLFGSPGIGWTTNIGDEVEEALDRHNGHHLVLRRASRGGQRGKTHCGLDIRSIND